MGQSASAVMLDVSGGKFGPFAGQFFVADYTLSLVMRAEMEKVDGLYQGACYPFRQSFATAPRSCDSKQMVLPRARNSLSVSPGKAGRLSRNK